MALLLKNAHVVDPSVELDGVVDVLIDGDKIAEVGENLHARFLQVRRSNPDVVASAPCA